MAVVPMVRATMDSTQVNMVMGMSFTIVDSAGQTPLTTSAMIRPISAEVWAVVLCGVVGGGLSLF